MGTKPMFNASYLNQTKATNSVVLGSWFFTGDIVIWTQIIIWF